MGKAMGNPVRLQILEELAQGPLTLDDLSARITLKTESIYHHIRVLQQVGLIEEFEPVRNGSPGRPYARFKLTGKTVTIQYPPRNYYLLSEILFHHLSELLSPDDLTARLRSIGQTIGIDIANTLTSDHKVDEWTLSKIRQHFVEDYLKSMRVQPEVVDSNETKLTYRQHNCLFLDLAKKYPDLICAMDEGLMKGLFNTLIPNSEAKQLKCLGHGDSYCEYTLTKS